MQSSRTVALLSGDAAVMLVHDVSSARQLIAQCHEGQCGVLNTILPQTHPCLPPTLTMIADPSDPYVTHEDVRRLHTNQTTHKYTSVTLKKNMTYNETRHKFQLRHSEPEITQVLGDVSHSGRYSEHQLAYASVKCYDQSTNKTKKNFLRFLQTSMTVTRMWVAKSATR